MKINFTKLQTATGSIKVSLDGGQSFTEHNLEDLYESGISLSDDQDYEKIQIQAPANILKNLNVVSSVKVEAEADLSEYIQKEYFQGEFYDGSCGYGYRLISEPGDVNSYSSILYDLYLSNGISLGELCEYNGDSMFIPSSEELPTGQLYIKWAYSEGCPGSYTMVPTQFYLK